MGYTMLHSCLKVRDLPKSLAFYREALHLQERGRIQLGDVILVYLGDEMGSAHELELNFHPEHAMVEAQESSRTHIGFAVADYEASLAHHRAMGCVAFVSSANNIYFIRDPDGYLLEIMPEGHFSVTERGRLHEN